MVEKVYAALEQSIAAYVGSPLFAPYDSRYDRYLRGEYQMTSEEELGRILFVSGLTNCRQCHQLDTLSHSASEPFTSFQYRNIGIPGNPALQAGSGPDAGLIRNPAVSDPDMMGKFKVPDTT